MTIQVTQEDIDHGEHGQFGTCPVAIAIMRATGEDTYVGLNFFMIGSLSFRMPARVNERIRHFDEQAEMEPFEFELPYEVRA